MIKNPCDKVHEFVDGELDKYEATCFCDHLVSCPSCQMELEDALQLGWLTAELQANEARDTLTTESCPGTDKISDNGSGPIIGSGQGVGSG